MRFDEFRNPKDQRLAMAKLHPRRIVADQIKHERLIRALAAQITSAANAPKPSRQDIAIAAERVAALQKRANLEFSHAQANRAKKLKAQKAARNRLGQLGLANYKV